MLVSVQDRYTALMWAAECPDPRAARALLSSQTTDVDMVSLSVRCHNEQAFCIVVWLVVADVVVLWLYDDRRKNKVRS